MNKLIRDDDDESPVSPTIETSPVQSATRPAVKPTRQRNGPYAGLRQVTGDIDPELFKRLKLLSFHTERPLVEIYGEALTAYVQTYAAENKFAAEAPPSRLRISRRAEREGCAVTAHVAPDLFKWLRAIHMQTRKTMGLILEEALLKHYNSLSAQRKFNAEA